MRQRLGPAFTENCQRIQYNQDGSEVDGYWIADAHDLPNLTSRKEVNEKCLTMMFIHGQ